MHCWQLWAVHPSESSLASCLTRSSCANRQRRRRMGRKHRRNASRERATQDGGRLTAVSNNNQTKDTLTVAVLGTGRMASIHLAALAELRDRGLKVDGKTVHVEPAVYGRDLAKVRAVAEQYGIRRTSTGLK